MKILYFYHSQDAMVAQYVDALSEAVAASAQVAKADSLRHFRKTLLSFRPDIVHLHGCWQTSFAVAARIARSRGVRIVLSPHGGLEPWLMRQHYWKEKFPKIILYQRHLVRTAYALVAMGRMEEGCLQRLRWNTRCETVLNALITDSLTADEMGRRMVAVYQKVMDSNQWPLMADDTAVALAALVKAGQTGDERWLSADELSACRALRGDEMRKLLLYAHQEGIADIVDRGFQVLGTVLPDIDASAVPCYYPSGYSPQNIHSLNVSGTTDEQRLLTMLRSAKKLYRHGHLSMRHAVELTAALRQCHVNESKLSDALEEKHLLKFACSLMQALADLLSLEEGFMPVKAVAGRRADKIETLITKHLEI